MESHLDVDEVEEVSVELDRVAGREEHHHLRHSPHLLDTRQPAVVLLH